MLRKYATFLVFAASFMGCGGSPNPAQETKSSSAAKNVVTAKDSSKTEAEAETSGLKELDETDRKLAEKQKYCPVGEGLLGSMGKPYKMTVNGRVIFLCCPHCAEEVNKDPDGTLKKVDALLAKK